MTLNDNNKNIKKSYKNITSYRDRKSIKHNKKLIYLEINSHKGKAQF